MPHAPADAALVKPAARVAGRVRVPGDKSISHRYAMLAALADGRSTIRGYLTGADCLSTLSCLQALGVEIERDPQRPDALIEIVGVGLRGLRAPTAPLDAGNSGTTMRLMSGVLAAHEFRSTLTGDASLSRRPMKRVIRPLTEMGATIGSSDGRPPLVIDGAKLRPITHRPEVPSAQIKSAVLLAGLQTEGTTTVLEPVATRDHTERAFHEFGVQVQKNGEEISVTGGQRLTGRPDLVVPGDVSSATFWIALAAGTPGADVEIEGVGLNPTRTAMLEIARRAGARLDVQVETEGGGEPVGRIRVRFGSPRSFTIEPHEVPGVIDEIPGLAALGALLPEGAEMRVSGASELRVKESDRISCLAAGIRAMGGAIDEHPDGFRIIARPLNGGTVDAADDHRLAMAFAVAGARARNPTTIVGASSVDVSYPGFFDTLERLTR
jgi:3-phosphoshikimate 1-carboxyvinyltransferase